MSFLSYIIWDVDPSVFSFSEIPRWYGLLFAVGFLISQQIMFYLYRQEGKPEKDVETLTIFMVVATIIGARLGHVFFYEPEKYLAHPLDILKIWEGGLASHGAAFGILFGLWLYTNYEIKIKFLWVIKDLLGIPIGVKSKKIKREGQSYFQVVDRIVIVVAITGCLIRFGNFMNSEIYGIPTGSNYGVIFAKNVEKIFMTDSSPIEKLTIKKDGSRKPNDKGYVPVTLDIDFKNQSEVLTEASLTKYLEGRFSSIITNYSYANEHVVLPKTKLDYTIEKVNDGHFKAKVKAFGIVRHPTQLYESITSLLIGILLFLIWMRYKKDTPPGLLLGLFLVLLFGLRFVHEMFKVNQVAFENNMEFNMGQLLSIPLIIAGIIIFVRAIRMMPKK